VLAERAGIPIMTTPRGNLVSISATFKRLARQGDVVGFRRYLCGDDFLKSFNGLDPDRRQSVMRAYAKAEALCEVRALHPLIKPKRIGARRTEKSSWSDPVMRARLERAYGQAGGNDERAARALGVSVGSARLARKRHLDPAVRDHL
jgi:hypothetical protein